VQRLSGTAWLLEYELCRRVLALMSANRPGLVVQIENRRNRYYVHVSFVVGLKGPNVAPVKRLFLVFVYEVETVYAIVIDHLRQNVLAKIVARLLVLGVFKQHRDQDICVEEINAHRAGHFVRISGISNLCEARLLFKAGYPDQLTQLQSDKYRQDRSEWLPASRPRLNRCAGEA